MYIYIYIYTYIHIYICIRGQGALHRRFPHAVALRCPAAGIHI